jgi:hypothetical protein
MRRYTFCMYSYSEDFCNTNHYLLCDQNVSRSIQLRMTRSISVSKGMRSLVGGGLETFYGLIPSFNLRKCKVAICKCIFHHFCRSKATIHSFNRGNLYLSNLKVSMKTISTTFVCIGRYECIFIKCCS